MDPVIVFTVLAVMGLAASLTVGVWRAAVRPTGGTSFEDALETITQSNELEVQDIELTVETERKRNWSWNSWWATAAEKSGRVVVDPAGPGRFMLGVTAVAAFFGFVVFPRGTAGILVPVFVLLLSRSWLLFEESKRKASLDKQLPLLLSALRSQIYSGQTVQSAIMQVANDMPSPLGDELRQVRDEVNVSVPLEKALNDMADRVGSRTIQFLVSSIEIAIRSGSDLVPQLITIEEIVRQRSRIAGKIRAAVALAKPTSYLALGVIPAAFLWMTFTTPRYLSYFLGDGLIVLASAALLYVFGAIIIAIMVKNVENI